MPSDPADPPDDVAELRAMIAAQSAEIAAQQTRLAEALAERDAQQAELAAARAGLLEQRYEIEALRARLARALRVAFGRSSERLREQVEQLELTLADIDELLAETTPQAAPQAAAEAPTEEPSRPARRPLPQTLPRDLVVHAAPGACPACGGALRPPGEDVTEILDYVPGSFRVIRHERPKLSCRACETIAQAPAPSLPVARGRAGPGLLAHVLVAKYGDHLPLHRQAEIYAREDIDPARRWPTWWGKRRAWCGRWWTRWRGTSWPASGYMPTTPWCRCWSLAWAGRARPGCGLTFVTTVRSPARRRRRCSTATRPIARASTRGRT